MTRTSLSISQFVLTVKEIAVCLLSARIIFRFIGLEGLQIVNENVKR
jgi:hypothetical protein